jgi:hypothetical protein
MPNYPALQEQDVTEPLDFSNLKYDFSTELSQSFNNAYSHYQFNQIAKNLTNIKPDPSTPVSYPVSDEDIKNFTLERPGLKIPVGTPKFIGAMMANMYDNDKTFSLVSQHPANIFGRIAAFGGAMGGGAADPKTWIYGGAAGKVGSAVVTSIAEKALAGFGADAIYGSTASRIGTLLAQSAGEGGGFGVGAQTATELDEQAKNTALNQPHEYIRSLQNVGYSGLFGAMFGLSARTIGLGLVGREATRMPDGSIVEHLPNGKSPVEGGEVVRQGGLLNRPEFKGMAQTAKDYIGKIYKPWSMDSDITMKEEATGQMMNGQMPDVGVVMKQGMTDEGANFRQAVRREPSIDVEAFDRQLAEAQENITSEMFAEHFAEKFNEPVKAGEKIIPVDREGAVTAAPILYRGYGENVEHGVVNDPVLGKGYWMTPSKSYAELYGKNLETLQREFNLYDLDKGNDAEINELYKNIKKSADVAERKVLKEELRQNAKDKGYEGFKVEKVQTPEVMFFDKPKTDKQLAKEAKDRRMADLYSQYALAQSLRDHINDTHEPLTTEDVQAYSEHLKTPGIPDNGYRTESPNAEFTTDDYLAEFDENQMRQLQDKIGDSEMMREIEMTQDKLSKQDTFKKMAQDLTDCLLKGGIV